MRIWRWLCFGVMALFLAVDGEDGLNKARPFGARREELRGLLFRDADYG